MHNIKLGILIACYIIESKERQRCTEKTRLRTAERWDSERSEQWEEGARRKGVGGGRRGEACALEFVERWRRERRVAK